MSFHIGSLRIGDWIKGWHLEYLWQHNADGTITLEKGATQGAIAIGNLLTLINSPEGAAIKALISNEGQDTIDKVEATLIKLETDLENLKTLPDLSVDLKDYVFSKDARENTFIHNIVDTATLALNDGKVSVLEGLMFVTLILGYIKGN